MDLSNISFFKMSPFNLWLNPSIFMDLIIFWSSFWMNPSSYGLVILIQRVVEPVHFMNLRLNLSTFMDLNFLIILLYESVLLRSCDFNSTCCWTHPLYGLEVEPVHFYGPHNFLIILLDEPVLFWTCNFNSMCCWTCPLGALEVEPVHFYGPHNFQITFLYESVYFWGELVYFRLNFRSPSMGWNRPLCGL